MGSCWGLLLRFLLLGRGLRSFCCHLILAWQEDREHSAGTLRGLRGSDFERAAVAGDDFAADPEPQACALVAFGGKKRLKDTGHGVGGDTRTGIGNRQRNAASSGAPISAVAAANDEAPLVTRH